MKNVYSKPHLMAFLILLCCFSASIFAQTMPTPQNLPYTQDFSTLSPTITDYPVGLTGWNASTSPGATYNTRGTGATDKPLVANGKASTSSGGIYNFDQKIGFLNTSSLDHTLVLAINTVGKTAIQVQYDVMTIRNPYDVPPASSNTRVSEMVLQYRIGTTATFTSVLSTAYSNNDVKQTTAITTPQNLNNIKITLPTECENEPIVQLRWISRQVSGGGSRPSFAIDNIDIRSDIEAPISAVGYPKASTILSSSFDFSNKLNEIGKTYFVLLEYGSPIPTATQIKAGLNANDVAALQSGFLDITDASQEYMTNFTGLTLNTSYSVFSISEDAYGNIQPIVNKVDVTTSSIVTPSIFTAITSLNLGFSEANYASESVSYQIKATDLTNDVVVSAPTNFLISKDNTTFENSLNYNVADFASNATQTVYVQFIPNATGSFSGQLTNESLGATTKNITLSGIGINPYIQGFNDANVLTNSGWTEYNVAGSTNKWTYSSTARNVNSGTGAVVMNGYSDTGVSTDLLISPKLHLDTFGQFPLLSFYSRKFYTGSNLKLMVSTDYDGKSNPNTASWTELQGNFPTTTGTYVQSQYINLSAYKTSHTYLAWVYETTAGGTNFAAEWSLDDVAITNESGYVAANPILDFGEVNANTISESQSFVFKADGYNDITINAPSDYQLSLDNSSFTTSVVVSALDAAAGKEVYVLFAPSAKALSISGALTVTGTGLNKQIGSFVGSSLPKADTFDIVTYNLEFFGTDVKGTDGVEFGPTDDALQIDNVAKVMNKLNADVYVVQEVADEPALEQLIQKISINGKTFDKTISPSWSYSFEAADPNFPPQKLVVLYNTQTATVKSTRVLFKDLYDEVRAGTKTLPNYPGGNADSFFASGRLPYMVQIETNLGGIKKLINLVDLHARANSGTDVSKYNMRKYDAEFLKDSLDVYYPNSNLILLGDFNDDVKTSVIAGNPSSYEAFVNDATHYNALTLSISNAGSYSFLSSGGFLDHIITSNELADEYVTNSIAVYDPRTDIPNYVNTTSDHGPVIARFELKNDSPLSVLQPAINANFIVKTYPNPVVNSVNISVITKNDKNLKLKLYDSNGRLIINSLEINRYKTENTFSLNISNLKSGIYFYTLSEDNKVIYSNKIIKK